MRLWSWEGVGIHLPTPDIFVLTRSFHYQNITEFDISAAVAEIVSLILLVLLVLVGANCHQFLASGLFSCQYTQHFETTVFYILYQLSWDILALAA
jgi:hypothetical protein